MDALINIVCWQYYAGNAHSRAKPRFPGKPRFPDKAPVANARFPDNAPVANAHFPGQRSLWPTPLWAMSAKAAFSAAHERTQHHGKSQQTNECPTGGTPTNRLGV